MLDYTRIKTTRCDIPCESMAHNDFGANKHKESLEAVSKRSGWLGTSEVSPQIQRFPGGSRCSTPATLLQQPPLGSITFWQHHVLKPLLNCGPTCGVVGKAAGPRLKGPEAVSKLVGQTGEPNARKTQARRELRSPNNGVEMRSTQIAARPYARVGNAADHYTSWGPEIGQISRSRK